jgi:hypothetical protein
MRNTRLAASDAPGLPAESPPMYDWWRIEGQQPRLTRSRMAEHCLKQIASHTGAQRT